MSVLLPLNLMYDHSSDESTSNLTNLSIFPNKHASIIQYPGNPQISNTPPTTPAQLYPTTTPTTLPNIYPTDKGMGIINDMATALFNDILTTMASFTDDDTNTNTNYNANANFNNLASGFDDTSPLGRSGQNVNLTNATIAALVPTQFPHHMLGFTAACAFIIAILGASGNLLTIIALPLSRSLRTTATAFVINLAVVELLFCVLVLPLSGAQYAYLMITKTSLLSDRACNYFAVMRYSLTQLELQTILAIALMRALAVSCMGCYARINNPRVVTGYIAFLWLYSFSIRIPTGMGVFGHYRFNPRTMECDMGSDVSSLKARFVLIILEAAVPVLLIFFLYIFIFIMVKRSSRRVARLTLKRNQQQQQQALSAAGGSGDGGGGGGSDGGEGRRRSSAATSIKGMKRLLSQGSITFTRRSSNLSQKMNATSRRDMRVARTIFIIFVMILVCSVPVAVVHVIDQKVEYKRRFLALHILYWVQYCANVVIYVLMNRQYRDAYVDLLTKLVPSWQKHHGYTFPWETPSTTNKQFTVNNSSIRSRKGSLLESQSNKETDLKCVALHHRPGRLSAIPEKMSNSASAGDEALATNINCSAVLPLATPPDSPNMDSPPQSPLSPYSPVDSGSQHSPDSPLSPLKTQSPTISSLKPLNTQQNEPQTQDNFKSNQYDKLDTVSINSSTPLQEHERILPVENEPQNLNSKPFYSSVSGATLQAPTGDVV